MRAKCPEWVVWPWAWISLAIYITSQIVALCQGSRLLTIVAPVLMGVGVVGCSLGAALGVFEDQESWTIISARFQTTWLGLLGLSIGVILSRFRADKDS
jgi:hypothetical protein